MSLRFFHIVFITLSCVMCLVVGFWAFRAYETDASMTWLGLSLLAFFGSGFLSVYGHRFLQKMAKLALAGLFVAGTLGRPAELLACTVCLGNTHSSLRDGMNAGILALLGFATFMIASFAVFFIYLARKARQASAAEAGFARPTTDEQGDAVHA